MFNTQLFNTVPFNTADPFLEAVLSVASYIGYSFNSSVFRLREMSDIEDWPTLKRNDYDIAEAHGEGLYSYYFKNKKITIQGKLAWETVTELEENMTALKAALALHGQTLKYQRIDGKLLETTASVTNLKFDRKAYHLTFVPVEIEFTTIDPFFYWTVLNQVNFEWRVANFTWNVPYTTGSFNAFPLILLTFVGATSVTSVEITLNGTQITINENISPSDTILINCKTRDISINSIPGVDYEGTFPELSIGTNPIVVDIDWTWEADIYVLWNNTYV